MIIDRQCAPISSWKKVKIQKMNSCIGDSNKVFKSFTSGKVSCGDAQYGSTVKQLRTYNSKLTKCEQVLAYVVLISRIWLTYTCRSADTIRKNSTRTGNFTNTNMYRDHWRGSLLFIFFFILTSCVTSDNLLFLARSTPRCAS